MPRYSIKIWDNMPVFGGAEASVAITQPTPSATLKMTSQGTPPMRWAVFLNGLKVGDGFGVVSLATDVANVLYPGANSLEFVMARTATDPLLISASLETEAVTPPPPPALGAVSPLIVATPVALIGAWLISKVGR